MTGAIAVVVAVFLVIIDQIIKSFVFDKLLPIGIVEFIPGFVRFRYVENTGAAFGILEEKTGFLIAITIVVIILGFYILLTKKLNGKIQYIGAVLILSGGIGNLIDRIVRHYVIDYIEFTFVNFAVFNFADCLITVGSILVILSIIKEMIDDSKKKKREASND